MMKAIFKIFTILTLGLIMLSCEDDLATKIEGVAIEDTDLIQIDDSNPNATIYVTAQSSNLNSIKVSLSPEDSPEDVYSATINKITADKLNRVKVDVPFPTPDIAPSGTYTVSVSLNGSEKSTSYSVNLINNRSILYCTNFPAVPNGKVGIFVSVPGGAALTGGKDIYIVGDFMEANGAAGNWNPGNPDFKLTKLGDQCYYIFLNTFPSGANFKFTLGTWDEEFLDFRGNGLDNQKSKGGNTANLTIYNFKTRPVTQYILPETLPSSAIVSGYNTVVVNVGKVSNDAKYYLIEKGATTLTDAIPMYPVVGTTKLAGAVPKGSAGMEFEIVKDEISNVAAVSANAFGFNPVKYSFEILDGEVNPYYEETSAIGFSKELQKVYSTILLVGGASPAGWNNSGTNTQLFTKVDDSHFTLTINLADNGSGGYLLITEVGNWDSKIGKDGGTALTGTMKPGGGDFSPPPAPGTYKIDLNLVTATYTLTLQ